MFTISMDFIKNHHWRYISESLIYAALAVVCIGQLFFLNGTMTYIHAISALLGVIFSTMAIYRLLPVNNWLDGRQITLPADAVILSFERKPNPSVKPVQTHNQHCA
jgi:hypothetical protein